MEPASNETAEAKQAANGDESEGPALDEGEFLKCSRKGRRDACPDIHCKCDDSKQSAGECLLHKEAVATADSKENTEEKT